MRAGPIMYGLHRRATLERAGNVPAVLLSDVLFLSHLSLYGTFVQVPDVLWYRGLRRTGASSGRQRAALFANPPLSTFLPFSLQHTLWLLRTMVFGQRRPPGMTRADAMRVAIFYFASWYGRLVSRSVKKNRKWQRKRVKTLRRQRSSLRKYLRRVSRFRH
jgi:hypothetical protein